MQYVLKLELADFYKGRTKTLKLKRHVPCKTCNGKIKERERKKRKKEKQTHTHTHTNT